MDELESPFGGKVEESFDIKKYAEKMKEDDAKRIALSKGDTFSETNNTLKSNSDTKEVDEEMKLVEYQKIIAS
ncbi:hypothetical protein Tco_1024129 [Tanacetum coccineum]